MSGDEWPTADDLATVVCEVRARCRELSSEVVIAAAGAILNARATLRAAGIGGADDIAAMEQCIGDHLAEIAKMLRLLVPGSET